MIGIIDYHAGNIASVAYQLQRLKAPFFISSIPEELAKADKLIFPGVGHALHAMQKLHEFNLIPFIQQWKKPFLGICLGMQLMGKWMEEGNCEGLNLVPFNVKAFPKTDKIPHMGWNTLNTTADNPLFHNFLNVSEVYFVHSYYMEDNPFAIATCEYILTFSAAIQKDNFFGVQFHPEKSAHFGDILMINFLNLR